MKITKGKDYILFTDVDIPDSLIKELSEGATHLYRDEKGNIINQIVCLR